MDAVKLAKLRKLLRLAADGSNANESKLAAERALQLVGNDDRSDFVEASDVPRDYTVVNAVIVALTVKAVLLDVAPPDAAIWFPLSQLTDEARACLEASTRGDSIEIAVPDWVLRNHGL